MIELVNKSGASVVLSPVGAAIVSVTVPDAKGVMADVCLGYDKDATYVNDGPYLGKCPGRFANRIGLGRFSLDGVEYKLPINNGPNHLHGCPEGFSEREWDAKVEGNVVTFSLVSPDGDCGYPGKLSVSVRYAWSDDNVLSMEFKARTDAPTILNLTNHAYWNLDGHGKGSILDHKLQIKASRWLPTDKTQIPTGEIAPVKGTVMDFTAPVRLGDHIHDEVEPIQIAKGYDHCWVFDKVAEGELSVVLSSERSGRTMEVYTDQPGVQIYTGNWLEGCPAGKGGAHYGDYCGVAIECQNFPDAPNKTNFPSCVLRPGELFSRKIAYKFR